MRSECIPCTCCDLYMYVDVLLRIDYSTAKNAE